MECGAAYEQKFGAPIVINGILFYNRFEERGFTNVEQEVVAVDLHTGEELWVRNWNNTRLMVGQLFYWDSYNYHGTFAYLWSTTGTTWNAYDAFTGRWVYAMTNVPATTASYGGSFGSNTILGPKGEIYAFTVDLENGWMTLWNSSRVVSDEGSWRPHGNVYDCSWDQPRNGGYEWNITIPKGLPGSVRAYELEQRVIGSNYSPEGIDIWALSLKPGQEGSLMFNHKWNAPSNWAANLSISWSGTSLAENVGLVWAKETRQWWGFSLENGNYLWGPTEPEQYLGIYGTSTAIANGKLYQCYMSGIVYCYDIQTGKLLWTHEVKDPLNEILWGNNWPMRIQFVADNKLYLVHGEHSPVDPKPRGGPMVVLDAETGDEIWSMSMYYYYRTNVVMGDSIIALMNSYDQQIYAIGKGPSAITVTAPQSIQDFETPVLVQGMVTDVSPGTEEYARTSRFQNGIPAVSDESMSAWMQYVYMQYPRPANITGVNVTISVLDPNNNIYEVASTTSDENGYFNALFTPQVPGTYTIIASFPGSAAYYGSNAQTALNIAQEPTPTSTSQLSEQTSLSEQYFIPSVVAIIAAIAIVGAIILLALKKR